MWSFTWNQPRAVKALRCAVAAVVFAAAAGASASTPDWLRQVAQVPLPAYPDDTNAVVLLDERMTTVTPAGEVHTTYRKAYKILRPQGRSLGTVIVHFDSETQITFLKGWSITSRSEEYEVKEKDAIETSMFSEALYADTRYKLLQIPAPDPGSVIGYEYQQQERSSVLQAIWAFQDEIPVRRARFFLELPSNWTYSPYWFNHTAVTPQPAGENRWTWELTDVAPIQSEPKMPPWRALAGHLGISLAPPGPVASQKSYGTWRQIGSWYTSLASSRRDVTPQVRDKTQELTVGAADVLEKIRRITSYVQRNIRYVAIEIGIGGYQPHAAQDVFSSGYGDCKDKVTLLSAMLREAGIDSYYVLINSDRDFLTPDFPTMLSFDHVVLAVRLPEEAATGNLFATLRHEKLGPLLFFDPTDSLTPLGYLPPSLQSNPGLLVTGEGGELVTLPLQPPLTNRLLREAKLNLDHSGNLQGVVQEFRTGPVAASLRARLLSLPKSQRQKVFQDLLATLLDGAVLTSASISNLENVDQALVLQYALSAPAYAQHAGELLLFHPCALGSKSSDLLEGKPRKQPVEFAYTASESDILEISYPAEYRVDELPPPVSYQYPFATYKSDLRAAEHVLYYSRTYELKDVRVPVERLEDLKRLFRQVADDEGAYSILKAAVPAK